MGDIGKLRAHWTSSAPIRGNVAERSPESVSEVLRHARLLQGYSLNEVAAALHIREAHLSAIEEGRFDELPPLVYAQGFVASYAGFLQLDRGEMVARFKDEAANDSPTPLPVQARHRPANTSRPVYGRGLSMAMPPLTLPSLTLPDFGSSDSTDTRMAPSGLMLAAAFTVLLLAYGLWHMMSASPSVDVLNVPPLPERFLEAPPALPTTPALPDAAPVQTPARQTNATPTIAPAALVSSITGTTLQAAPVYVTPTAADHIITLRARGETWVQLHNEAGQRVASFVLKAGEGYTLPAGAKRYKLTTGNLALIDISIDGQTIAHPRSGRELMLDASALQSSARH